MTTPAAAAFYLAEHLLKLEGRPYQFYNPENKPIESLPVIFGFNNGGSEDWWHAQLIAEDGTALGGHICSHEGYMRHDLGILEGTRPDRHEAFRQHYPDGYRMAFVPLSEVESCEALKRAFELNAAMKPEEEVK